MDINEIKQVPIVDFLYILGIEPVKHKASVRPAQVANPQ